ncbi:MAG TPA: hypothetical protein VLV28_05315 [Gaiellaceae bacterium]|nr:hypothetical protein [Gaiellaceae bacterium]
MTTVPHEPVVARPERPQWAEFLKIREMWASLAISMMWLAVLFDAIYGASLVSSNSSGSTTIPSAIVVAFFAWLGSMTVAKYGLGRSEKK